MRQKLHEAVPTKLLFVPPSTEAAPPASPPWSSKSAIRHAAFIPAGRAMTGKYILRYGNVGKDWAISLNWAPKKPEIIIKDTKYQN
jgi:hypothetical protein